jgi:methionyl-tRNA formyltransferase
MRVIFVGTSVLAASVLSFLTKACIEVAAVFTVLSKAVPGKDPLYTDVERVAYLCKLPVFGDFFLSNFFCARLCSNMFVDFIIVVSSGIILDKSILSAPRFGCLNVHLAVLPRFSGPAPLHYTFLTVDCFTGVTIIKMLEDVDDGPVVTVKYCRSFYCETFNILCVRLCYMVIYVLWKFLVLFSYNAVLPIEQNLYIKMQTKKIDVVCFYLRGMYKRMLF